MLEQSSFYSWDVSVFCASLILSFVCLMMATNLISFQQSFLHVSFILCERITVWRTDDIFEMKWKKNWTKVVHWSKIKLFHCRHQHTEKSETFSQLGNFKLEFLGFCWAKKKTKNVIQIISYSNPYVAERQKTHIVWWMRSENKRQNKAISSLFVSPEAIKWIKSFNKFLPFQPPRLTLTC